MTGKEIIKKLSEIRGDIYVTLHGKHDVSYMKATKAHIREWARPYWSVDTTLALVEHQNSGDFYLDTEY